MESLKINQEDKSIKLKDMIEYMETVEKISPDFKKLWMGLKQGLKIHSGEKNGR